MIVDMLDRKRLPWQEVDERKRVEEMKAKAMANPKQLFSEEVKKIFRLFQISDLNPFFLSPAKGACPYCGLFD